MSPPLRRTLIVLLLLGLCTACVRVPDSGDVEVGDERGTSAQDSGFPYDPRPPQPGERATEIVQHFLDAMMANPTTTAVAKQFLSEQARESWHPDRAMITYDDIVTPQGSNDVSVTLLNANHLNGRGVWQGRLPEKESVLDFEMTVEDGEWRIDDPPDAMVVSDEFFETRYRQVSLYFLDPTAKVVVPEPVFVPRGGQLSAVLMRGLLLGPGPSLGGVTRSYIPDDLSLDLSSPVSPDGVAEVSLRGEAAGLDAESVELMTVQIAWTLRQDPSVRRVRLTINDTPVTVSGTSSDFDVDLGEAYTPVGAGSSQSLFALRDNRMISSIGGGENRVAGPFGTSDQELRSVSVNLDASQVAGVSTEGSSVVLAPVDDDPEHPAETIVTDGTNVLTPAWDVSGRLWMVDRTTRGAAVSYWFKGRRHRVRVPGITGEAVTRFLVSRDGTRLIAVLRRPRGDVVVQSRLMLNGSRVRGTRAEVVRRDAGETVRIRDLDWHSPTELVAARVITDELSQITTFSVDGSNAVQSSDVPVELVRDKVVRLISSPDAATNPWAIAASGRIYDLSPDTAGDAPPEGLRSLTFVG